MSQIELFIPTVLLVSLALFAVLGLREFIRESSIALKKKSHA